MPKSLITKLATLAVRSTAKASNTANIAFAAARNARVSIVRSLNTPAISKLDTFIETSQQNYASKTNAYARLRFALETGAETTSQALHTLRSLDFMVILEECETAILLNIENAKRSNNQEYAIEHMAKAFELMAAMKKEGFMVGERIYGPLLKFLIYMKMMEEFYMIFEMIWDGKEISPELARLGYYEMLLWIQLKDEEKIEEVCSMITKNFKEYRGHNRCVLRESYMLALCEKDQQKEVLRILETLDARVCSFEILTSIFEHLGRSISESVAKKLLRELNKKGLYCFRNSKVSELIFGYVTSIPNMWVGGALVKFNELLEELKVSPSSTSYQKLIIYSCDSREEEIGLCILEHMYEVGLEVSSDTAIYLFRTIEQNYEFDLLRGVQNVLRRMSKEKDESRMFNLRLAIYIWEVLFGRCEPKHKEGGHYKPWLKNKFFSSQLYDYDYSSYYWIDDYDYDYASGDESECYYDSEDDL